MNSIRVLYSFARSGGTLVNQLLGKHPQCLVLSEVSPAAAYKSVEVQALDWLDLIEASELIDFSELSYCQKITRLFERATSQGKQLIIRDWVTVNFLPKTVGAGVVPSHQLEQAIYLKHAGFRVLPLVVTRKSRAVYQSIINNFTHLSGLSADVFSEAYLAYAQAVKDYPIIHLEGMQRNPAEVVVEMLQMLELDSGDVDLMLSKFHEFEKCTGNNTLRELGESALAKKILPDAAAKTSQENMTEKSIENMAEADRLLGYE